MEDSIKEEVMPDCSPDNCIAHDYIMSALERFDKLSEKLSDGQQKMQLTLGKLSEQMETTKRLHERTDRLEERVLKIETFMWKFMGAIGAVTVACSVGIPIIMKLVFGV